MGRCLGIAPSTKSAMVTVNTVEEVKPGSLKSLEGRNLVNICPNGACEESIGSHAKSRCQWIGCLIKAKLEPRRHDRLNLQGPKELRKRLRH